MRNKAHISNQVAQSKEWLNQSQKLRFLKPQLKA